MKPRASASFCHCPNDTSTPSSHVGPSCVSRPLGSRATTSSAPARPTAAATAGSSSRRGWSPTPTLWRASSSKRKKSWNAPAIRSRHAAVGIVARSTPSTVMRPAVGRYMPASSLTSVVLPAPFSPTTATTEPAGSVHVDVVEREPVGARVAERDVLEADAVGEPVGRRGRRPLVVRGHVVLEPRQPQRRVEPDAAEEAELADGLGDVLRRAAGRRRRRARRRPTGRSRPRATHTMPSA